MEHSICFAEFCYIFHSCSLPSHLLAFAEMPLFIGSQCCGKNRFQQEHLIDSDFIGFYDEGLCYIPWALLTFAQPFSFLFFWKFIAQEVEFLAFVAKSKPFHFKGSNRDEPDAVLTVLIEDEFCRLENMEYHIYSVIRFGLLLEISKDRLPEAD
ncbi:General Transcription And Dna Repair Factor Iih Helicase Subunit Xpd [Manis pentadactyla]|nr:General Transcription And Dna Repair Factor Iih Helicase Subunit Xpd [Manis pentadactyla]